MHNYEDTILKRILVVVLVLSLLFLFVRTFPEKKECLNRSKVVKILSLDYRDATIMLDSGKIMSVNQATLKIGDTICSEWGVKDND